MKAKNFRDDIPSIQIDIFKDHFVLVFDSTSMQDGTESSHYTELVEKLLELGLIFIFLLEHVTELIATGERMSWVANPVFLERASKKLMFLSSKNIIPFLKFQYLDSFPPVYVPILPNETLASINKQPSNMKSEHWIKIADFCQKSYFADSFAREL